MNHIYTWKIISDNNKYSWEALNKEMETIGKSNQLFDTCEEAELNADYLGRDGDVEKDLDWSIFENDDKTWSWLVDDSHELKRLGYSHKFFDSKSDAMKNANQFGFNWRDGLRAGLNMTGFVESDLVKISRTNTNINSSVDVDSNTNFAEIEKQFNKEVRDETNQIKNLKISGISETTKNTAKMASGVAGVVTSGAIGAVASGVRKVNSQNLSDYDEMTTKKVKSSAGQIKEDRGIEDFKGDEGDEGDKVGFGWLKWLLPLILLFLLLFWLVPGFKSMFGMKDSNVSNISMSSSLVSVNGMKAGFDISKLGNLGLGLKSPDFSKFGSLLSLSGLAPKINQLGVDGVTLLAPNNLALNSISADNLTKLQSPTNLTGLQDFLNSYMLKGKVNLIEIKDNLSKGINVPDLEFLSGRKVTPSLKDGELMLGDVVLKDIVPVADSGVGTYNLSSLFGNTLTDLDTLKTEAMSSMSTTSVMSASSITSSNSTTQASVSVAPAPIIVSYTEGGTMKTLQNDARFTTLFKAIEVAGLGAVVDSGEFTIFAPTDEAFKTAQSTVDNLLKLENKSQLQSFLKNHLVAGKNGADKFYSNTELTTLAGNKVKLQINEAGFGIVVGAKNTIEAPVEDINTPKSVIHIITNAPLLP